MRTVKFEDEDGKQEVVISRSGEVKITDPEGGRVFVSHHIPYGAKIMVKDKQKIRRGDMICHWDIFNAVIISEFPGIIKYDSIEEGVTFRTERDDQTGYEEKVIIESKNKKKIPSISIVTKDGEELRNYNLPVGSYISVSDGDEITAGKIIGKIPRCV